MKTSERLRANFGGNLREAVGSPEQRPPQPLPAQPASGGNALQGRERLKGACTLPLDMIVPDPAQPRTVFPDEELRAFAVQLQEHGQLQPIRVRWNTEIQLYTIICGERRWRAAKLAGWTRLDCIVVEGDLAPEDLLEEQLAENLTRADLDPMDEARGLRRWLEQHPHCTQTDCAKTFGISQTRVSKALARLDQPAVVQELLSAGKLSGEAVVELAKLPDLADRERLAREAADLGLTVAQVRNKVKLKTICDQPGEDQARPRIYQPSGLSRTSYTYPIGDVTIKVSSNRPLTPQEIETAMETALLQHREKGGLAA